MQYLHMHQAHAGSGHAQLAANDHFVSQSVRTIIEAFSVIIEFSEKFAQLSGVTSRIWQLLDALAKLHAVQRSKTKSTSSDSAATGNCKPTVRFDRVDIVTPSGDCLAESLSVDVDASSPLMITGLNGCGKSSVARVLSGIWPARGVGSLSVPSNMKLHLVPQKVYSCQGSMADQLTYPIRIPKEERTVDIETRLQACLEMVNLGYLSTREDAGWDAVLKWEDVLSLGEQQRMGMARMFYESPRFAVLDEATSAVSMDVEVQLYQAAAEQQMTLITISQRLALTQFHKQELRLGMETRAGWTLHQVSN